jgi:hypothetical protein
LAHNNSKPFLGYFSDFAQTRGLDWRGSGADLRRIGKLMGLPNSARKFGQLKFFSFYQHLSNSRKIIKNRFFVEKFRPEIRVIRPNLGLRFAMSSTPLRPLQRIRACFPTLASSGPSWPWQLAARGNDVITNEHAQLRTRPLLVSCYLLTVLGSPCHWIWPREALIFKSLHHVQNIYLLQHSLCF